MSPVTSGVRLGLVITFALAACTGGSTKPSVRSNAPLASPTLRLSEEAVPTDQHLRSDSFSEDARFIEDTQTGGFDITPHDPAPGSRLVLSGSGCRGAETVHLSLYLIRKPKRAGHVHESGGRLIDSETFDVRDPSGWSGSLTLPKRMKNPDFSVTAICELGGHAYYPSSLDVHVTNPRRR